ncbi:hypothetical protein NIES4106_25990 [Fischerella sp. NIES-4106]|jgi:hypothetical protein|nr:hypothetical protein NIES4106_25990 [Fischerella sp. NIES-4106]
MAIEFIGLIKVVLKYPIPYFIGISNSSGARGTSIFRIGVLVFLGEGLGILVLSL